MFDKSSTALSIIPAKWVITCAGFAFFVFIANPAPAADPHQKTCGPTDTACLLPQLEDLSGLIENTSWRDQTYREIAKLYAAQGNTDTAIKIIPKINSDDTKALTIRGIGMALENQNLQQEKLTGIFLELRTAADKIEAAPSRAIALTYIAMAQAHTKDNAGALATAKSMTNAALRHKALGESAEIQAKRGELDVALESLAAIDDLSFRNKANGKVARAFANIGQFDNALTAANKIETNPYEKSQALLYILAKQITPDEITLGIKTKPGEVEP